MNIVYKKTKYGVALSTMNKFAWAGRAGGDHLRDFSIGLEKYKVVQIFPM